MTIKELIKQWCEASGYDGLCNPDAECGCTLKDLPLCDGDFSECEPGYAGNEDTEWAIYLRREDRDRAVAEAEVKRLERRIKELQAQLAEASQ